MTGPRVMDYKRETLKRRRRKFLASYRFLAYIKIPLVGYIIICNIYIIYITKDIYLN